MRLNREIKISKSKVVGWMIIFAVAAIVGVCCMMCPWIDDDLIYQYNVRWSEHAIFVPIKTIGDVFESQYYHYLYTNGRFVAHWLVQLYDGILGRTAFAISDAIVYILFIRLIMAFCGIRISNWQGVLTAACLVITCQCVRMTPAFQMYIWMYLLVLCYIWILLHYHTKKWWMLILLCIFSIICGNAHESLNPAVFGGIAIYFMFNFRKISLQQWLMFVFFGVGMVTILVSPGTQNRIAAFGLPLEYRILAIYTIKDAIPAFYILLAITLYKIVFKKENLITLIKRDLLWWAIWGTSIAVILYMGFSGGRAVLGEELAAIILTLKLLKKGSFTPFWLTLLSAVTIIFLYCQFYKILETNRYIDEIKRQALISTDGNIYIDFKYSRPIAGLESYTGRIYNANFVGKRDEARMMDLVSLHFTKKWNIDHSIRFYPTALRPYIEGKVDTTAGNTIADITTDTYLIVMNKKHPANFYITYKRDIPLFEKEYAPKELSLYPEIYDTDQWKATVVSKDYYYKFYPATFSMSSAESDFQK